MIDPLGFLWSLLSWKMIVVGAIILLFVVKWSLGINLFVVVLWPFKKLFGWASGRNATAGKVLTVATSWKKPIIMGLKILLVVGLIWWVWPAASGGKQAVAKPPEIAKMGWWDSFWKEKKVVEILIDGDLKDAVINPPSVDVKGGQNVAIQVDGVIIQNPKIGDYSVLNPAKVIKFTSPGWAGEFRLNKQKMTEFVVNSDGQLKFSLDYSHFVPSTFHSGKISGDNLDIKPLKITVIFMDEFTGKGGPPKKIEEIVGSISSLSVPGLEELKKIVPDTKEVDQAVSKNKKAAENFWKKDPTGIEIQKGMETFKDGLEETEDSLLEEVKKLPEKKAELKNKIFNKKIR